MGSCDKFLPEGLKKGIILDGLEAIYSGRDFLKWARNYRHHEEIIFPGELEFVGRFRDYFLSRGLPRQISNPRYDFEIVDRICLDLG